VPVSLALTWAAHIATSFSYSASRSLVNQAGSVTQNDHNESSASLSFSFRVPYELLPLKSDIRTAFRFSSSDTKGCITLAGSSDCTSILDSQRQQYNFQMDTDMPPSVSAGFSVGYILTNDAYLDRKFAQFVLTLSVSVNFQAGQPR